MATTGQALEDFPSHGLLPKKETQVEGFLRKYPDYNGKDVLIAIFDTGVDPGAPGLQLLPSGDRKITDLIDCTGCGDVDTSTIETVAEDGTITGKSGRKLTIPSTWNNPSGQYRVGVKSAYLLYPGGACRRVKKEKKEEEWDVGHKIKLAQAVNNLAEFDVKHPSPSTETEKLEHENLSSCVEALKNFDKQIKDKGPYYDCVLFNDGEMWRACIDTSEGGRLEECNLLGPFNLTGDFAKIGDKDMVNYSFNVYDNGNILSIVTNSGSHGTHVASIAGAYFENEPELNGLAPGAKLVSMQIGDNRIGGMETGTGLIRAMKCAIDLKVDVINMSFGEASKWCQNGRVFDIIHKMVTEHNIIFLSSAGNDGPALSTVGAPPAISNEIIGVGAYVSPDMMKASYSIIEKMAGTQFTWSSNGPCADGKLGVCIVAPGGAITSVPNWTLSRGQLMNGTSMSSPNACGSVAVLLSALKAEGVEYSPFSIRKSLENTAQRIEGLSQFVQGQGMVQIDKAYEHIKEAAKADQFLKHVTFEVSYGCNKSGIYIREDADRLPPDTYNVSVEPKFHKKTDNAFKIEFNRKVALTSTHTWISSPSHLEINNGHRMFTIHVKKNTLRPGCHYGEVHGVDLACPSLGPLFRVPITVIVPEKVENSSHIDIGHQTYAEGGRKRWFYSVPKGATWAKVTLKSLEKEDCDVRYVVHCLQMLPEAAYSDNEFQKYIVLNPQSGKSEHAFRVKGGYTMELSVARWWKNSGESDVSIQLEFHGLNPNCSEITLTGANNFARVDVRSDLRTEQIKPAASLTHHVIPLSPKESLLKPLSERDLLPDNDQVFGLDLTYNFNLASSSEVTAVVPALLDVLYESQVESQFWMIYDSNKALRGYGDVFQHRMKYFHQLEKGDYVVKLQIRHSDFLLLERLKDITLNIHIALSAPVTLDTYSKRANIFETEKKKFSAKNLACSSTCPVYFTLPADDKLPKGHKPGEHFTGKVSFTTDEAAKKVCTFPLLLTPPPAKNSAEKKDAETKQLEDEYKEAHEEFLATWIGKLGGLELQNELLQTNSESIALNNALLNALDSAKTRTTNLEQIVATAKKIIEKIDQNEILTYIAMKVDPDDQATKRKKEIEKQKTFLINALYKMALAVADGILAQSKTTPVEGEEETSQFSVEDLDNCYRNFLKFVDATDGKMLMVIVRHGMVHQQYGRAIKALMKYFETNSTTKALYEVFIQLAISCGWYHVVKVLQNSYYGKFPASYEPF